MQRSAEDPLERPVEPWLRRAVGGVVLSSGLALAVFLGWFTYRVVLVGNQFQPFALAVFAISTALSAFLLLVGYRLLFNVANRYRSVLPPSGWYALAGVFMVLALGTAAMLLMTAHYDGLIGSAWSVVFAVGCYLAAQRAKRAEMPR